MKSLNLLRLELEFYPIFIVELYFYNFFGR